MNHFEYGGVPISACMTDTDQALMSVDVTESGISVARLMPGMLPVREPIPLQVHVNGRRTYLDESKPFPLLSEPAGSVEFIVR